MSQQSQFLLQLIASGLSLNEIQKQLALTTSQFSLLLKRLRDEGYNYIKTYNSLGEVYAKIKKEPNYNNINEHNALRINVKDHILRTVFIADLHIGSIFERPDILRDLVFNYMIKHDIHILFNGGDVIENVYEDRQETLRNKTVRSQVQKVLHLYPSSDNILSFNLYGNHDYKCLTDDGFDIARYFEEKRYDLISLGYGTSLIRLKDDAIAITHELNRYNKTKIPDSVTMIFKGHSHKAKNRENKLIYIPSLSEDKFITYEYRPLIGFLDVEFIFYDKLISKINIRHLAVVNGEIRLANEESITVKKEIEQKRTESLMTKKYKPKNSFDK